MTDDIQQQVEKARKPGFLEGYKTTTLIMLILGMSFIIWITFIQTQTNDKKFMFGAAILALMLYVSHKKTTTKPKITSYYSTRLVMDYIDRRKALFESTNGKEGIDPSTIVKIGNVAWPLFVHEGPRYYLIDVTMRLGSREKKYGAAVWLEDPLYGDVSMAEYPEGVTGRETPFIQMPETAFMKWAQDPRRLGIMKILGKYRD